MTKQSIVMCFGAAFVLLSIVHESTGSAIPMWEYLSRDEKMSHLYSMFAKQVQQYCKAIQDVHKPQCKRDLLMYGLSKLQAMNDGHLDTMDPYQRGANDIIWDSMMSGHPMTSNKKQTTTEAPINYPTGNYIHNPLFDEPLTTNKKPASSDSYALDMDLSYADEEPHTQNRLPAPTNVELQYLQPPPMNSHSSYLSGPMVVRVHPDGTPVVEDKYKPLPIDDDRDEMTIGRARLPSMEELSKQQKPQFAQRYAILPPPNRIQPPVNPLKQNYGYRFASHHQRRSLNSH
ncbi:rhythmically expressed gene 5 protein [Culicoides brevitarsis]|uniref:rhythmically expressed gene 5 protein n=1 Tax=Culicoides brevitarsis TaxID=469753 RepID=UPI00307B34DF